MIQTQADAPDPNLMLLINHLPGPERPVRKIEMWHGNERYGGFTSTTNAHLVAAALGFRECRIIDREPKP